MFVLSGDSHITFFFVQSLVVCEVLTTQNVLQVLFNPVIPDNIHLCACVCACVHALPCALSVKEAGNVLDSNIKQHRPTRSCAGPPCGQRRSVSLISALDARACPKHDL